MIGAVSALAIAAGLVSGCGASSDQGRVAAQVSPTSLADSPAGTTSTTTSTTTKPADSATTKALGAYPPADPKAPTMAGYDEFSRSRAGTVFMEPASLVAAKAAAEKAAAESTSSSSTSTSSPTDGATIPNPSGGSTTPSSPTTSAPSPSPTGTTPTPSPTPTAPKTAKEATASMKVDGAPVIAKAGTQIPSTSPLFTVSAIQADKVVLKLNEGKFPGGTNTVDIAGGASVTLSNPSTNKTIVIEVVSITPGTAK